MKAPMSFLDTNSLLAFEQRTNKDQWNGENEMVLYSNNMIRKTNSTHLMINTETKRIKKAANKITKD